MRVLDRFQQGARQPNGQQDEDPTQDGGDVLQSQPTARIMTTLPFDPPPMPKSSVPRPRRPTRTKKADVEEHPEVLPHVGLLVNRPPRNNRVALYLVVRANCWQSCDRVHRNTSKLIIISQLRRKVNTTLAFLGMLPSITLVCQQLPYLAGSCTSHRLVGELAHRGTVRLAQCLPHRSGANGSHAQFTDPPAQPKDERSPPRRQRVNACPTGSRIHWF